MLMLIIYIVIYNEYINEYAIKNRLCTIDMSDGYVYVNL